MGYESNINSDSIASAIANKFAEALNKAKDPVADAAANAVSDGINEGIDRAVKSISSHKLKINANDIIDIKFNDKKVSKDLLNKLNPIVSNINKNLDTVFDFKDTSKSIKSLRSSVGALYPLTNKLADSLNNAMNAYSKSGHTNIADVSKTLEEMIKVSDYILRSERALSVPKDTLDLSAVTSYADGLKDVIRGCEAYLELYSEIERKTKKDLGFFDFKNIDFGGLKSKYETEFERFSKEIQEAWFRQIKKLGDAKSGVSSKDINKIISSSGKLSSIYSLTDDIKNIRTQNKNKAYTNYIEAVANKYSVDVNTALEEMKRIANTRKFKGGNYKSVSEEFSGYLNAFLSGGGKKEDLAKLKLLDEASFDVDYYEGKVLSKDIVARINELVQAKLSAEEAMNILETKVRDANFSENDLKIFAAISKKYKEEKNYVELLTEAYETLKTVRDGSNKEVADALSSKSRIATDILKAKSGMSVRSNVEKKAALDYIVENRIPLPSKESDEYKEWKNKDSKTSSTVDELRKMRSESKENTDEFREMEKSLISFTENGNRGLRIFKAELESVKSNIEGVDKIVQRISKNSSVKGISVDDFPNAVGEINSNLSKLTARSLEGSEEWYTNLFKLSKILDKVKKSQGGLKGGEYSSLTEFFRMQLETWSFQNSEIDLNYLMDSILSEHGLIVGKSSSPRSMKNVASELFYGFDSKYMADGDYAYDQVLVGQFSNVIGYIEEYIVKTIEAKNETAKLVNEQKKVDVAKEKRMTLSPVVEEQKESNHIRILEQINAELEKEEENLRRINKEGEKLDENYLRLEKAKEKYESKAEKQGDFYSKDELIAVKNLFDSINKSDEYNKDLIKKSEMKTIYNQLVEMLSHFFAKHGGSKYLSQYKNTEDFTSNFNEMRFLKEMIDGKNAYGDKVSYSGKEAKKNLLAVMSYVRGIMSSIPGDKFYEQGYIPFEETDEWKEYSKKREENNKLYEESHERIANLRAEQTKLNQEKQGELELTREINKEESKKETSTPDGKMAHKPDFLDVQKAYEKLSDKEKEDHGKSIEYGLQATLFTQKVGKDNWEYEGLSDKYKELYNSVKSGALSAADAVKEFHKAQKEALLGTYEATFENFEDFYGGKQNKTNVTKFWKDHLDTTKENEPIPDSFYRLSKDEKNRLYKSAGLGISKKDSNAVDNIIDSNDKLANSNNDVVKSEQKKKQELATPAPSSSAENNANQIIDANEQIIESNNEVIESEEKKRKYTVSPNRPKIKSFPIITQPPTPPSSPTVPVNPIPVGPGPTSPPITPNNPVPVPVPVNPVPTPPKPSSSNKRIIKDEYGTKGWQETYTDAIGRKFAVGETFDKDGNPVSFDKTITTYTELENIAIKTMKKLMKAAADLAVENERLFPNPNVVKSLEAEIAGYDDKLRELRKTAQDFTNANPKKYSLSLYDTSITEGTAEYERELSTRLEKEFGRISAERERARISIENKLNEFLIKISKADDQYLHSLSKPIKDSDLLTMRKERDDLEDYIKSFIGKESLTPQESKDVRLRVSGYEKKAKDIQENNYSAFKLSAESTAVHVSELKRDIQGLMTTMQASEVETSHFEANLRSLLKTMNEMSDIDKPALDKFKEEYKLIRDEFNPINDNFKKIIKPDSDKSYAREIKAIREIYSLLSKIAELRRNNAKNQTEEIARYRSLIDSNNEIIKNERKYRTENGLNTKAGEESIKQVRSDSMAKSIAERKAYRAELEASLPLLQEIAEKENAAFNQKKNNEKQEKAIRNLENAIADYINKYKQLIVKTKQGVSYVEWENLSRAVDEANQKIAEYTDKAKTAGISEEKINNTINNSAKGFSEKGANLLLIQSYRDQIDKFEASLQDVGGTARVSIEYLRSQLDDLSNGLKDGLDVNVLRKLQDFGSGLEEYFSIIKKVNSNEIKISKKALSIEDLLGDLTGFDKTLGKVQDYRNKIEDFYKELVNIQSQYYKTDENGLPIKLNEDELNSIFKDLEKLENKVKDFSKNASSYALQNKNGKLVESSIGQIVNIDQLQNSLKAYGENAGYGSLIKISQAGEKVTATFKDQDGTIRKLTGTWEEASKAMRIAESTQRSFSSGNVLTRSLSEMSRYVSMYLDVGDVIRVVRRELSQAITTFKDYDSALTNVSYTMDLTREGLHDLGSDAVDLAEDLAMSVENAMNIYEIYANMNTTAEEIQAMATPTAILSNISGNSTDTTSDQIQGVLQQFNMLEDEAVNVADASMHVVDVLSNISANVSIDNVKAIGIMADAVKAAGAEAYQAGLSFEQLAAISAKVSERTRDDGSSIGNALKTIIVRLSKVGKMPGYEDEVSNEELSNASKSLNEIGIQVYESSGEFRELDVILGELSEKWDSLTDAQQANISYNVAATRQTSKFKNMLEAWTGAMELAEDAVDSQGAAMANQEKYEESFAGQLTQLQTKMDKFWIDFLDSGMVDFVLGLLNKLVDGFNSISESIGPATTGIAAFIAALLSVGHIKNFVQFIFDPKAIAKAFGKVFAHYGCESIVA